MSVDNILSRILEVEHGFQHILNGADEILSAYSKEKCFEVALTLFEHEAYQARMLATTLLGRLATEDNSALRFLPPNKHQRELACAGNACKGFR